MTPIRYYILGFMLMAVPAARGQDIDTLTTVDTPGATPSFLIPHPQIEPYSESPIFSEPTPSPLLRLTDNPVPATFLLDNTGIFGPLSGYGDRPSYPGMMNMRSACLNLSTSLGIADFTLWGEAVQIAGFRSYSRQFGYGANVRLNFTNRLSLTIFGSYYTPMHGLSPAMAGFLTTSRAGGYLSYDFSDHWGISVGAQTIRSDFDNRWRMQPIVMPYYKVNKNVSIGADIGGILYNALIDSGSRNPTIGPPRH